MRRAIALALVLLAAAAVAAACNGKGTKTTAPETIEGAAPTQPATTEVEVPEGDPAAGKELFGSAGCGGCHTLADAGTSGAVGPNLDQLKPAAAAVFTIVTDGRGSMPAFSGQLDEQQIADIAAYVVQATSG
ncbi:MAG: cytochrome c [Thermoleophilia bacterium]|nr:cytochrome c [Thermoleophilia bacterium]